MWWIIIISIIFILVTIFMVAAKFGGMCNFTTLLRPLFMSSEKCTSISV